MNKKMTTDNLIGKSKITKVGRPLILPRHMAVKRAQELKQLKEKGVINNNTSGKDIEKISKDVNKYSVIMIPWRGAGITRILKTGVVGKVENDDGF